MGAWELVDDSLIFTVKTVANLTGEELKKVIVFVGARADTFEERFVGNDDL